METQKALEGIMNIEDVLEVITFSTGERDSVEEDRNASKSSFVSSPTSNSSNATSSAQASASNGQLGCGQIEIQAVTEAPKGQKKNLANNIQVSTFYKTFISSLLIYDINRNFFKSHKTPAKAVLLLIRNWDFTCVTSQLTFYVYNLVSL